MGSCTKLLVAALVAGTVLTGANSAAALPRGGDDVARHTRITAALGASQPFGRWRPAPTPAPTPTPSPSATPTPPPAGATTAVPVGDLPGWTQVFRDDFTTPVPVGQFPGSTYGARWGGYDGQRDTSKRGLYAPSKVLSVSNGALTWAMHTENGVPLVAAPVPKLPTYGQSYGRYSVRFRTSSTPGYKMAFLLWPDSDRWDEGEIDWPEAGVLGQRPYAASLVPGSPSSAGGARFLPTGAATGGAAAPTDTSGWHVATTERTPGRIVASWDGVPVATVTSNVPTASMHWVLQAETQIGGAAPAASAVGRIEVDWAVAYRYSPTR